MHIEYVGRFWKGDKIGLLVLNDVLKDRLNDFAAVSAYNPWSWQEKIYGLGNELNAASSRIVRNLCVMTPPITTSGNTASGPRPGRGESIRQRGRLDLD